MPIAPIQSTSIGQSAATNTLTKAFTANNGSGNGLICISFCGSETVSVSSVSDSIANTNWALHTAQHSSATLGTSIEFWKCRNCIAGANSVTVLWNAVVGFPGFYISEMSAADLDSLLAGDATVTVNEVITATTAFTGIAVTPANGGAYIIIAAGFFNGGTTATGTGSTSVRDNDAASGREFVVADMTGGAGGVSYNNTATLSPADSYFAVQVAFKAAAAGGGGPIISDDDGYIINKFMASDGRVTVYA